MWSSSDVCVDAAFVHHCGMNLSVSVRFGRCSICSICYLLFIRILPLYNNGSDDTSGVINMANAQFMSVYILALISRKRWFSFQLKRLEILWWKFANHGSELELLISNLGRILWKYWNSQGKYDGNIHFCVSNSRLLNVYTRHCFDW